jgi:hypothetical protein
MSPELLPQCHKSKGQRFPFPVRAFDLAGGGFLDRIDSRDVINLVSWRYDRMAQWLADRPGIVPRRAVYARTCWGSIFSRFRTPKSSAAGTRIRFAPPACSTICIMPAAG